MNATSLEVRRQAIRQLVLRQLAPYARQLQPVELIWLADPPPHEEQLCLHVRNRSAPSLIIPFSNSQLASAVNPTDVDAYRHLQDYIWRNLQPLIG